MTIPLDSIDLSLLEELQRDADRPNVELARIVELSPAATLHRVRRLKESGIVSGIVARLDFMTPTIIGRIRMNSSHHLTNDA